MLPHFEEPDSIMWLIDSGCTETCLLADDVLRLQIPWRDLPDKQTSVITANGEIYPKLISDIEIWFRGKTGLFNNKNIEIGKQYHQMDIMCPPNDAVSNGDPFIPTSYSVLGMDFLKNFSKWDWRATRLILKS